MGDEFMQKFDPVKDAGRLRQTDAILMKRLEGINKTRAERLIKERKSNRIMGLSLGCLAIGIYLYTIHAMKQETFLDDLNEPEKIIIDTKKEE